MGVTMAEEAGSVLNQEMTPRASRFYCIVDQQTSWVGRIPILIFALQKWFPGYLWSGFYEIFHPVWHIASSKASPLASFPGLS